jgi:hypothetical protein
VETFINNDWFSSDENIRILSYSVALCIFFVVLCVTKIMIRTYTEGHRGITELHREIRNGLKFYINLMIFVKGIFPKIM